jgi:hypothetical protein
MEMNRNRIGRVKINESLLRHHWNEMLCMFGNFVPVEIRRNWSTQVSEYIGYSPLFDECPDFIEAPEYEFVIDGNKIPAEIRVERVK